MNKVQERPIQNNKSSIDQVRERIKTNRPLWANNKVCVCGDPVDPKIRANVTGLNYCSHECASEHVNAVWDPETESVRVDLSGFWLGGF